MRKSILEKMVWLQHGGINFLKTLFSSKILQGEGVVIDCRMQENIPFGIFSPQAMAFCDRAPQEESVFWITIAFNGKQYVMKKREFFCIGKRVIVSYRNCICGVIIENIKQAKQSLYH